MVKRLLELGACVMVANRNEKLAEKVLPELRRKLKLTEQELSFVKMVRSSRCSDFLARTNTLNPSQDACVNTDIERAFRTALAFSSNKLSIIIANAGFSTDVYMRDIKAANDTDWINGIQGNLVGTLMLGRLALTEWLKSEKEGVFVTTASVAGMHGMYALEGWRNRANGSMICGSTAEMDNG